MNDASPRRQLAGFLSRYSREIQSVAKKALSRMRRHVPGAIELVYDNYNALVVGFSSSERASDAIFSIALYPRWVSLFFLRGVTLSDPRHLLRGSGSRVRHIVLESAEDLDRPEVVALIERAKKAAKYRAAARGRLVIKSVSAKQRPRK